MEEWMDFTINSTTWQDFPELVDEVHADNKKFIIILDPGIKADYGQEDGTGPINGTYDTLTRALEQDVFMKDKDNAENLEAYVWPGKVYYPDFTNPGIHDWWADEIKMYHDQVKFDGLWIDMNEPANFHTQEEKFGLWPTEWYPNYTANLCTDELSNPKFVPQVTDNLWQKGVCLNTNFHAGLARDAKDLYGHSMSQATRHYYNRENKRGFILTRSQFASTGTHAQHWLGDNFASWDQLRQSIVSSFEYGMFGFSQVGPDICGFFSMDGNAPSEHLCTRWQQIGAFYSFSRNHNSYGEPAQEPTQWSEEAQAVMREAMRTRYALLPNLYTTMYFVSQGQSKSPIKTLGATTFRSYAFEFFYDLEALETEYQFMWGDYLMVVPNVHESIQTENGPVDNMTPAYFTSAAVWYGYYDYYVMPSGKYLIEAGDYVPLFIRGGKTLVKQPLTEDETTTVEGRDNDIEVVVALGSDGKSQGWLYWDDGESLDPDFVLVEFLGRNEDPGLVIAESAEFEMSVYDERMSWFLDGEKSKMKKKSKEFVEKITIFTTSLIQPRPTKNKQNHHSQPTRLQKASKCHHSRHRHTNHLGPII